jgi:hypothetical protein
LPAAYLAKSVLGVVLVLLLGDFLGLLLLRLGLHFLKKAKIQNVVRKFRLIPVQTSHCTYRFSISHNCEGV